MGSTPRAATGGQGLQNKANSARTRPELTHGPIRSQMWPGPSAKQSQFEATELFVPPEEQDATFGTLVHYDR
jgi:hypothetical protein